MLLGNLVRKRIRVFQILFPPQSRAHSGKIAENFRITNNGGIRNLAKNDGVVAMSLTVS